MAERVLINKQILQDSIDAIRAKKGTTASIVVADMPTEIASISGGGGIADSTKTLVGAISGVTPTDETTLNNAIAKAYADTPTEQKWNGTRSTADGGTIKDGVAFVESIKGSTIKINQLVKDATFADSSEWQNLNANCALSIANNVASISVLNTGRVGALPNTITPIDITHTYYMSFDIKADGATSVVYSLSYYGNDFTSFTSKAVSSSWTNISGVAQPRGTANVNGRLVVQFLNTAVGAVLYLRNFVCIDLTAMGQESLTADTLASYCGYSSPSDLSKLGFIPSTNLRNFTHNTISSKTKYKTIDVGTLAWSKTDAYFYVPSSTFKLPTTDATFSNGFPLVYNDSEVASNKPCFQRVSTTGALRVWNDSWTSIAQLVQALTGVICTYESTEYTEIDTLSLNVPSSVFPNGLCGVGTAYDEWKPAEGKAIKRADIIKFKDMGNFLLSAYANIFCVDILTMSSASTVAERKSGLYANCYGISATAGINDSMTDKSLLRIGQRLYIKDTAYSTPDEFKAHFTDNDKLCYELATESETTTDKAKAFYKVANGGTESVSGGENSTPIKADIGYREATATELINALNG